MFAERRRASKARREQAAIAYEHRWEFRAFGVTAYVLGFIPILSWILNFTTSVGAALWAVEMERSGQFRLLVSDRSERAWMRFTREPISCMSTIERCVPRHVGDQAMTGGMQAGPSFFTERASDPNSRPDTVSHVVHNCIGHSGHL